MVIAKVAGTRSLGGAVELGLGEQEVRWRRRFIPRPVPHRLGKIADLTDSSGSRNKGCGPCVPSGKTARAPGRGRLLLEEYLRGVCQSPSRLCVPLVPVCFLKVDIMRYPSGERLLS